MPLEAVKKIIGQKLCVHSIEIFRSGSVIFSRSFHDDKRYPVYSCAKSFTSAAFSIAAGEGLISPDIPLSEFIESRYRSLMSGDFRELPVRRFLTMTAGNYPFRPEGSDWLENILTLPVDNTDTGYHYSNIPAYLVGVAVENAVGGDLIGYLTSRLFEPLGIKDPVYAKCPHGHFYGATGMELTVTELRRLGQLYMQNGAFAGEQLIAPERINESLTPWVKTGDNDSYGYFFRVSENGFSICGKWGQRCLVYPEKQLIITYLSDLPDRHSEMLAIAQELAGRL